MVKLKDVQKGLVKEMKKDKDLKEYHKEIEELPLKSFKILVKILKKSSPLLENKWPKHSLKIAWRRDTQRFQRKYKRRFLIIFSSSTPKG